MLTPRLTLSFTARNAKADEAASHGLQIGSFEERSPQSVMLQQISKYSARRIATPQSCLKEDPPLNHAIMLTLLITNHHTLKSKSTADERNNCSRIALLGT
eukprot:TRINITY_DN12111_c0_g1_i1.p1 TRINITY_DN12111_c0_g1~~TRINITY_DN12111_c0_g1_i1.p1  ORF type:complete len:101 (+),score=6.22 TRINITY_DN12111_c0_g1_i1:398-700(+)